MLGLSAQMCEWDWAVDVVTADISTKELIKKGEEAGSRERRRRGGREAQWRQM